MDVNPDFVVVISANAEWRVIRGYFPNSPTTDSPFGKWIKYSYGNSSPILKPMVFLHGGWGKVAAAGSTQYVINTWKPKLLINIGTCGGFEGEIEKREIILVNKTIIYDIYEQMGDPEEHILHYSTEIDTSWLQDPLPLGAKRSLLISGDRDLFSKDIAFLKKKYGAIAGDWESGAIAWVASRNNTPCLILRGVTDLVGEGGGEAYNGNANIYHQNTVVIMRKLVESLPEWVTRYREYL